MEWIQCLNFASIGGGLGYGCGHLVVLAAIYGCIPCMWGVLCFFCGCVVEIDKCVLYVVVHGYVYIPFLVIAIKVQSTV